ncbi:hypothetical protein PC116_g23814 [Phytophthora cactorum]|nr:hypothetical protein PC116_g23814 [Phytophthora cactorum]
MKRKEEPQTPATSAPTLGAIPAPGKCEPKADGYAYGIPSSVTNAVWMIQPFYSGKSTVEKAQSLGNVFERATTSLNETVRQNKTKTKPVPENAMKQQMMTMMQQTENLLVQQQQQLTRSPRSPRRVEHAAAVNDEYFPNISMVTENTPSVAGSGRRMGPDTFTQDEMRVCSRCNLLVFGAARLAGTAIGRAIIADSVVT